MQFTFSVNGGFGIYAFFGAQRVCVPKRLVYRLGLMGKDLATNILNRNDRFRWQGSNQYVGLNLDVEEPKDDSILCAYCSTLRSPASARL